MPHVLRYLYSARLYGVVALGLLLLVPTVASAAEPGILYSADARGATIVKSGTTLRLSVPANTRTAWFTDRPERRAGSTTLAGLVAVWDASGFRKDPPNAALLLTHRGETRTHVVTLSDPRHVRGRVSFRLRAVPRGVEAGHAHTHDLVAGRYGRAALFIDDAAYPPCPTVTVSRSISCLIGTFQPVILANYPPWDPPTITVTACKYGGQGQGTVQVFVGSETASALAPPCPTQSSPIQISGAPQSFLMVVRPADSPPLLIDIRYP